jgi:hypothetical protein
MGYSHSKIVVFLLLVLIFTLPNSTLAVRGEGTATIAKDGGVQGAGVSVVQSTSHVFTIVFTVGDSGITANAENPTFTIPAGFTAPDATYVANAGLVVADGDWSVIGGGTCLVESPVVGLTKAVGQVITVDVSTDCTVGPGGIITLTYKGTSSTVGVTSVDVATNDVISAQPVKSISEAPNNATLPTITVTAADVTSPTVVVTMDDDALNIGDTSLVTFTFSEVPIGFTTLDVAVANGSIGAINAGNPLIQTATYTPTNSITDATNVITVGTDWTDTALNTGVGGDSPNYTINTIILSSSGNINNTITVIKQVINDNGGTASYVDFPLFVNGNLVTSGASTPFASGTYMVTETTRPGYTRTFTGNCDANGVINHGGISTHNNICIIVNNDIGTPATLVVPPLIDVVKVPSPLTLPTGSGSVTYTYTLRNIGTVPVTNITMAGDTCSPIILSSGDVNTNSILEVNETWVYHCTSTLSKTHTNTVTTTGWANGISAIDVTSATVVVGASIVPPLIHVTKVPNVFALAVPGAVTYTYTVTNPGTMPLSAVSITDDKCTGLPGRTSGHPGDLNRNNLLESNEAWIFTCQTKLTKTTTNTGTAEGSANGLTVKDYAIATVAVSNAAATAPGLPKTGFPPLEKYEFIKNFFKIFNIFY